MDLHEIYLKEVVNGPLINQGNNDFLFLKDLGIAGIIERIYNMVETVSDIDLAVERYQDTVNESKDDFFDNWNSVKNSFKEKVKKYLSGVNDVYTSYLLDKYSKGNFKGLEKLVKINDVGSDILNFLEENYYEHYFPGHCLVDSYNTIKKNYRDLDIIRHVEGVLSDDCNSDDRDFFLGFFKEKLYELHNIGHTVNLIDKYLEEM